MYKGCVYLASCVFLFFLYAIDRIGPGPIFCSIVLFYFSASNELERLQRDEREVGDTIQRFICMNTGVAI